MDYALRRKRRRGFGTLLALGLFGLALGPGNPVRGQEIHPPVGQEVPAFFVRDVTSSRPHRAVCLVCRYGDRPVVLLAVRKLNPRVVQLLQRIDRLVDQHRAAGLRGFAVFLGGELPQWQPRLYTLARRQKLKLPLVLPVQRSGPDQLAFRSRVPLTVVLYHRREVRARYELQLEQLTPERIDQLERAARRLLAPAVPLAAPCPRTTDDCPAG